MDPRDTPGYRTHRALSNLSDIDIDEYDEHGSGIRHRGQLDRILDESEDLWIVPADVHF